MALRRKARRTARKRDRFVWPMVAAGSALAAAAATRGVTKLGWKAMRRRTLPSDPAQAELPWGRALAWAAGTGAIAGGMRLLAERGAAAGWKRFTGTRPPRR